MTLQASWLHGRYDMKDSFCRHCYNFWGCWLDKTNKAMISFGKALRKELEPITKKLNKILGEGMKQQKIKGYKESIEIEISSHRIGIASNNEKIKKLKWDISRLELNTKYHKEIIKQLQK